MGLKCRRQYVTVVTGCAVLLTGCGGGQYLLPPRLGGNPAARGYQQAVEQRYLTLQANLRRAIASEEVAIAHDPRWAPAYARLANLFLAAGQPSAALKVAGQAAHMAPLNAQYQTNLGKLAAHVGDGTMALAAYRRALAINPADWMALDGLAALDVNTHKYALAQNWLAQAMTAGGPQALTWEVSGELQQAEGDSTLATRFYRQAMVADPSWWKPHYDLAVLAYRKGKVVAAENQLRSALNRDPASSQAWLLLEKLPGWLSTWAHHSVMRYPHADPPTPQTVSGGFLFPGR